MANKVKFGLSNIHIAARTESDLGVISYETPVALSGAVGLTMTRASEKATFRADNVDYFTRYISSSREGSMEIADIPDWFKTGFLGYKAASDDKLVETNAQGGAFAILFQVETDLGNKKYCIYNVQAVQADEEHKTTEANDLGVQTSTLNITINGEQVGDFICFIKEVADFTSVAVPTFPSSN